MFCLGSACVALLLLLSCGRALPKKGPPGDQTGVAGSAGGAGTGGMGGNAGVDGGAPAGSGGTGSGGQPPGDPNSINLDGSPIYTRMQRLTNGQWERAVTDVLRFASPANLPQDFSTPASGDGTDFANNEKRLFVDLQAAARLRGRLREGRGARDGVRRRAGAAVRGHRRGRVRADRGTTRVPPSADDRRGGEVPGHLRAGRETLRRGLRKRGRPRHSRAVAVAEVPVPLRARAGGRAAGRLRGRLEALVLAARHDAQRRAAGCSRCGRARCRRWARARGARDARTARGRRDHA